ncbi:hypothetical protein VZT92_000984 [Zoarces viviparus]|uniref:Uncharacterized protein n=1 Tax=Zoarces viviparus TaxID=48416 RepID=A0AAW1G8Y9_ZOAVI
MFPDQQRTPRPADARLGQDIRPPAWMEDYAVSLPGRQQSSHSPHLVTHLSEQQRLYHSVESFPERKARMMSNSLRRRPAAERSLEIIEALHRLMENNQRLQ